MSYNEITDLESPAGMDNLGILTANSNKIKSIEVIKHLELTIIVCC